MKPDAPELHRALEKVLTEDRGRLIAALIADIGDFELAEEALADAIESALVHWARNGCPANSRAWLLRAARRKAIDRIRRLGRWRARIPDLRLLAEADEAASAMEPPEIKDERLRLIFTCCHPALDEKSRVALTLRTIGGLTTGEIARAFLDKEATMGQRISRAKTKIANAGIPYKIPEPEDLPERLNSVLAVVYLIFNEGYSASSGSEFLRVDLCEEAIFLARLLNQLCPDPEVLGLLSLILSTHARRHARLDSTGGFVPLSQQDRALWDNSLIEDGLSSLNRALPYLRSGPYQIKAAISALHVQAKSPQETDWRQMLLLYDALLSFEDTPVVRLNRALVVSELVGPDEALSQIDSLQSSLNDYQPFHAARADLLARLGQVNEAMNAYSNAIDLTNSKPERAFLKSRLLGLRLN